MKVHVVDGVGPGTKRYAAGWDYNFRLSASQRAEVDALVRYGWDFAEAVEAALEPSDGFSFTQSAREAGHGDAARTEV